MLMLTSQIYADDYPRKAIKANGDTVVEFTPLQAKGYRLALVELESCELENVALKEIVTRQDTVIQSKVELQKLSEQIHAENEEVKAKLDASLQLSFLRFDDMKKKMDEENSRLKRQIKWNGIKVGTSIGGVTAIAIIFALLKTFKVF
jgi:chemotaxis response regulator CheB